MLKRIRQVILDNPTVPANAEVTTLATDVDNAIEAIDNAATEQTNGEGDIAGGVATKRRKVRRVARLPQGRRPRGALARPQPASRRRRTLRPPAQQEPDTGSSTTVAALTTGPATTAEGGTLA